jgi:hypothetical protein
MTYSSRGELYIVYMDRGSLFLSCSECYVDRRRFFGFHYLFLNQFWFASRIVCSLCVAMVVLLSAATTAVSSAKLAVAD